MARLYADFIEGTLTADPGAAGTTLNAAILASLPVVASPDTLKLVLDPEQVGGAPEIVTVTTHTSSATSATIVRGEDGTSARAHAIGITVTNAPVASDMTFVDQIVNYGVVGEAVVTVTPDSGGRFYLPWAATIMGIKVSAGTAPTGAAIIVDINKNGTTIFTTQGNRPTLTAGSNTVAEVTNMNITSLASGDYVTCDIDQIGSTVAGSDLSIQVRIRRVG